MRTSARADEPRLVRHIAKGPLTAHHISALTNQPFSRYGNGVRTCARAGVPAMRYHVKRAANGYLSTLSLSAIDWAIPSYS